MPPKNNKILQKPKNSIKTIIRIFSYALEYKWKILLVVISIFITTFSRVVGNGLLTILVDNYITPLTKNFNNTLFNKFILFLIFLGIIYLFGVSCAYFYNKLVVVIFQKVLYKIRIDLFDKMEKLPLKYFDSKNHGEIMTLYTNDIDAMRNMLTESLPEFIYAIFSIIGIFGMMFFCSWKLSLVVIFLVFWMILAGRFFGKNTGKYFKERQDVLGKINGFIEEMIEGQKIIKIFNHENKTKTDFDKINEELYKITTTANTYANIMMPMMVGLSTFNYVAIVIVGAIWIILGNLTLGILVAFTQFIRGIGYPIMSISQEFNNILTALAGAERVFEVMDMKPEIDNGNVVLKLKNKKLLWKDKNKYIDFQGNIQFHNVIFTYNNKKIVLNSINMNAKKGQKIALVGSTGAGKTTITNLINRFYDIQSGEITIDGINIKNIKKADLRKTISIVLQDTHLFTGTVLDNVKYGNLKATDKEVIEACKIANADDFIKHLPQGYNTILTTDGENLSQGEKQLLAIARAIVSKSQILILDEATSSIDTRTEKLIENAMQKLMIGKTVFIIAHRLSTIKNADYIVVIENGKILESGNHNELLEIKGRYYNLYNGISELK